MTRSVKSYAVLDTTRMAEKGQFHIPIGPNLTLSEHTSVDPVPPKWMAIETLT